MEPRGSDSGPAVANEANAGARILIIDDGELLVTNEVKEALTDYQRRGNVREIVHIVQRATIVQRKLGGQVLASLEAHRYRRRNDRILGPTAVNVEARALPPRLAEDVPAHLNLLGHIADAYAPPPRTGVGQRFAGGQFVRLGEGEASRLRHPAIHVKFRANLTERIVPSEHVQDQHLHPHVHVGADLAVDVVFIGRRGRV